MLFCPHCGNMLLVESAASAGAASSAVASGMRFYCQTCPYIQPIEQRFTKKLPLTRKKVDDVLGGDKAWDNVDTTDEQCPSCDNRKAYYMQIQIRAADEPMTIFYRCTVCKTNWSSNG